MKTIATIRNGQMERTHTQAALRRQWLTSLKDGTVVSENLARVRESKTQKQLATIFGLAFTHICQELEDRGWDASTLYRLPEPTGIGINKDMLLSYFYVMFPVFDNDKRITLSKMNIRQAAEFYEQIVAWASSQWQIYVPEPNPEWKTKVKEK